MRMNKVIGLVVILTSSALNANEFFLDFSQGISTGTVKLQSVNYVDPALPVSNSYEITTSVFEAKLGYSFYIKKDLFLEPSISAGYLSNRGDSFRISPLYSLELPLMYRASYVKYGLLAKYNYYPKITTDSSYGSVVFKNKDSFSLGAKIILNGGKTIDYFLKYEYTLNANYKESFVKTNSVNNIKLDMNGGYISVGIRFKF